jgi:predicted nuclease with TOPRIM domain
MAPSGFPTGTVSSGRDDPSSAVSARTGEHEGDPQARIAELERENQALREAVAKQRRENERIVERYERLLDGCETDHERETGANPEREDGAATERGGVVDRVVGLLTYRG